MVWQINNFWLKYQNCFINSNNYKAQNSELPLSKIISHGKNMDSCIVLFNPAGTEGVEIQDLHSTWSLDVYEP